MSKVTYNVIYQVCGQVTADIPDDITTPDCSAQINLAGSQKRTG